jgi:DNA-binding transcriptional LysR family regulator
MTLDQFRYFLAAARFQHVAKAARSVAISPSAVSTAIATLEDEFGCRLFDRHGKNIVLNDQGKYLRDQLDALFDQLSVIEKSLKGADRGVQGSYRLGASHFLSARYLSRAFVALQRQYPRINAELCSMATAQAVTEVLRGTVDLALCFSPLRHPDLRQIDIYKGELRLVVRKGHPCLRKKGPIAQLSDYPATIHKSAPGVEICELHPMFEKFGVRPDIRCQFDSDDQAVENLSQTDSWSLLPDLVVDAYSSKLSLVPIPNGWDAPYTVAAVIRPHRDQNPSIARLLDELRTLFGSEEGGPARGNVRVWERSRRRGPRTTE